MKTMLMAFILRMAFFEPKAIGQAIDPKSEDNKIYTEKINLFDETGKAYHLDSWAGSNVLLTMAYTNCNKTCPMTVHTMQDIERRLTKEGKSAEFLIVSLDPTGDTTERIQAFRREHQILGSRWHYLKTSPDETKILASKLGIDPFSLDEHIVHKFKIWALRPNGSTAKVLDWQDRDLGEIFH